MTMTPTPGPSEADTPQQDAPASGSPVFRSIRPAAETEGRLRSEGLRELLRKAAAEHPLEPALDAEDPDAEDAPVPCP